MPFKYPFTVFKGSFFGAFLKQMYTVSDFCKDPRPTSHKLTDKSYGLERFFANKMCYQSGVFYLLNKSKASSKLISPSESCSRAFDLQESSSYSDGYSTASTISSR